ncbi:MAG TPA: aldo/keto reductase [Anaerolineaceae bacterium]
MQNQVNILEGCEMGIGTWAWGDRMLWGFGQGYAEPDLKAVFDMCVQAGVKFFDTAESYGQGKSEEILGRFLKNEEHDLIIASKFMPYPWRLNRRTLLRALRSSLKRLGLNKLGLYQMHWPFPPVKIESWMDAMADAFQAGLISAVGVSNYDQSQMQRAFDSLAREGISLTSNQVEYHLLNRKIEKNGLLEKAKKQGIQIIAYSPLAMGMLTGKYSTNQLPSGVRGWRYNTKELQRIQPLLTTMRKIGAGLSKTPAQIALNWIICKGAIPIPGAKTLAQAEQNLGALGWRLSADELAELDLVSDQISREI